MGFTDVIKHLPHIKRLESELLVHIERRRPDVAILVDYPGFHMRLAESLKKLGIKVVQYVAPQLWAWGENVQSDSSESLTWFWVSCLLKKSFFLKRGVHYRYVGTPQIDRVARMQMDPRFSELPTGEKLLGFFPKSVGEVTRILPKMKELRENLRARSEKPKFVVSVAPSVGAEAFRPMLKESEYPDFEKALSDSGIYRSGDTSFVKGSSLALMARVDAALVASGTATLECALSQTPMAVAYVMTSLSYQIAKRLVKLPHISLVNLVADQGLIREFIQDFSIEELSDHVYSLLFDAALRARLDQGFLDLKQKLKSDLAANASREILGWLEASSNPKVKIS